MIRCALIIVILILSSLVYGQNSSSEVKFSDHSFQWGYGIKKKNNSALFQGNKRTKKYFEGWYFKMVSADESSVLSVIPGISISNDGNEQHAFIQVIDGNTAETKYFSFHIDEFFFSKDKFAVRIGDNYFSKDSLILNIQNENTSIQGHVSMTNHRALTPQNKRRKEIMGWYRKVPLMQCYHGVVSLNHSLNGELEMNDKAFNFEGGKGYIEKDWGASMPSSWIWIQSNNFTSQNTSFMLSVANIPWVGNSFNGFLGFFLHNHVITRFGTYTNADLHLDVSKKDTLSITIEDKHYTYNLETHRSQAGELKAPIKGAMDRRISESVDAYLKLTVIDKNNQIILCDSTFIAGLEMVGNIEELNDED